MTPDKQRVAMGEAMSEREFYQEYMGSFPDEEPARKRLRELAQQFVKEADEFDEKMCSGPIVNGERMPIDSRERNLCINNASWLKAVLLKEVEKLGFDRKSFNNAIQDVEQRKARKHL